MSCLDTEMSDTEKQKSQTKRKRSNQFASVEAAGETDTRVHILHPKSHEGRKLVWYWSYKTTASCTREPSVNSAVSAAAAARTWRRRTHWAVRHQCMRWSLSSAKLKRLLVLEASCQLQSLHQEALLCTSTNPDKVTVQYVY